MTAAPGDGAVARRTVTAHRVAVIGPHILDVLGRPVESIPVGQGSARLTEIRATAAGTAAGTGVDLAKLGVSVRSIGAVGTDLLADILLAALTSHGIDTGGLVRTAAAQTSATILPIRPNGERPALHVPGATRLLRLADIDLTGLVGFDAVLLGGPDALAGLSGAPTWQPSSRRRTVVRPTAVRPTAVRPTAVRPTAVRPTAMARSSPWMSCTPAANVTS